MQKVRYYIQDFWLALTACMIAGSGSISPVIDLLFHLSLTVLFTIATSSILSLRGWFPDVHASLLSHYSNHISFQLEYFLCTDIASIQGYHLLRITYSKVFCVAMFPVGLILFRSPLL